ncbi:hypothetical protein BJ742DRAFT_69413 [Cladochytrium replicatum]|nr:hypothetical protein BJ742DRAFT_69413 [Cladochytrium replicatum]
MVAFLMQNLKFVHPAVQVEHSAEAGFSLSAKSLIAKGTCLIEEYPFIRWVSAELPGSTYNPARIAAQTILLFNKENEEWLTGWFEATDDGVNWNKGIIEEARYKSASRPPWKALYPRDDEIETIPEARRLEAAELVKSHLPNANSQLIAEAVELYFDLQCNAFPSGLLHFISNCNHSCDPNSRVDEFTSETNSNPRDVEYRLTTMADIAPGEPILISYLHTASNTTALPLEYRTAAARQRHLSRTYFFDCQCKRCRNAEGESVRCPGCSVGAVNWITRLCGACGIEVDEKKWDRIEERVTQLSRQTVDCVNSLEPRKIPGKLAGNDLKRVVDLKKRALGWVHETHWICEVLDECIAK